MDRRKPEQKNVAFPRTKVHAVRKIAVVRPNALGDYIFTLPALAALRTAYPSAEIVLLGRRWHADFLRGRPGPVDRVAVIPLKKGIYADPLTDPAERPSLERFLGRMRAERFDIALQLYGGGRYANPITRRLGARVTAGFKADDAEPLDRWIPYIFYHPEVLRYLEAAALVGAPPVVLEPELVVTAADLRDSRPFRDRSGRPLAVLHPGTTDSRRRWPSRKFASVAAVLLRAGATVAVTGEGGEAAVARAVVAGTGNQALNLCGRLSLKALTGILSRAAVVVSNDSGPLHLARAVGAPTVGIYWIGNVINAGPLSSERHRVHFSWRVNCPTCGADCTRIACPHRSSFVDDIDERAVARSALELIGAG